MRISSFEQRWQIVCACGFSTRPTCTLEAAGRAMDLHLAERFPNGSERVECKPGKPTMVHGVPFEYDPTLLKLGEGPVIGRT